jgi:hypothetical protein
VRRVKILDKTQVSSKRDDRLTMDTPDVPLLDDVAYAGRAYHRAMSELETVRALLYERVRAAVQEGVPASKVARAAGLSRERVRQIVAKRPDDSEP